MPRYKITIEYDGAPYVGWQMQADGRSVQGEITAAVTRFSNEETTVRGAGRTDSGVHARGQVAHFNLTKAWHTWKIREALNFWLKDQPITVLDCEEVDDAFDARFSATARHYRYRILSRRAPAAIERDRVWWTPVPLDPDRMHEAAQRLLGRHDFTTFRAAGCQAKSPIRTLDRLDVTTQFDEIWIEASARSFLHSQVRSMAGALKHVGAGKWTADDLAAAFAACDRTQCPPVAPACGLYFIAVDYDQPGNS